MDASLAIDHQLLTADETVAEAREKLRLARDAENEEVTGIREIMIMKRADDPQPTHILERAVTKRIGIEAQLIFSGGVALNNGLASALEKQLELEIQVPPNPDIIGALGAALLAGKTD